MHKTSPFSLPKPHSLRFTDYIENAWFIQNTTQKKSLGREKFLRSTTGFRGVICLQKSKKIPRIAWAIVFLNLQATTSYKLYEQNKLIAYHLQCSFLYSIKSQLYVKMVSIHSIQVQFEALVLKFVIPFTRKSLFKALKCMIITNPELSVWFVSAMH